jgi:hypothetical protein
MVASPKPAVEKEKSKGAVAWGVFGTRSVLGIMACQMAYNNLTLTIETWAPTMLAERFALSPVQIGSLLAAPQAIRTFGGFAIAALESFLIRRGVALLEIRRWMTVCSQVPEAISAVLYGMAKTPRQATLCYAAFVASGLLNYSGAWANEMEVFGADAAIVGAVGNVVANSFGVIVPFMGVWLRQSTGSWLPHLVFGATLKLLATAMFASGATLEDARTSLARRGQKVIK